MDKTFHYSIENNRGRQLYRLWENNPEYPYLIDKGGEYNLKRLFEFEPRLLDTPVAERVIEGY